MGEPQISDLTLCVLSGGSSGNCLYLGTRATGLLVDAGLSAKETMARLETIAVAPETINGICLTHEHADHIAGLRPLHNRHNLPLYANAGTIEAVRTDPALRDLAWQVFESGSPFEIGDISIEAFSIPHDAADPVGFVFQAAGLKAVVAMDVGMPTELLRRRLRGANVMVIEANHDLRMLEDANRPWYLKQRIKGRQGHLSNQAAADLLAETAGPELTDVFLTHLSPECNTVEAALSAAKEGLAHAGCSNVRVHPTFPDRPSKVCVITPADATPPHA